MKRKIKEVIHKIYFDGEEAEIKFSDFPNDLKETDEIHINREESYSSENNAYDGYSELIVIREREETDEEYENRMLENKKNSERMKKNRYENYLKLKSEFEGEHNLFEKK